VDASVIANLASRLPREDRTALAIIAGFTIFRLVLAAVVGLGVDEAYTVSVAHDLELSYYDHPPLQYWITHLFLPGLGDGRAARLPFVALFAGTSWLVYRLTQVLFEAPAGVLAVLALNSSAFFAYAAGTFVLPDGPLLFALSAAALALARGLFSADPMRPGALRTWLAGGFWLGVAGLCKYQAVLFALGVLIFLVSVRSRRRLLVRPGPWLGVLLALFIASPAIVWNIRHGWVSVAFQAGRGSATGGLHMEHVLANIAGQAIWVLPWIFVPLGLAAWRALRAGPAAQRSWYCLCLALPAVVLFSLVPLWGRIGLPHWQMPGWLFAYPVLGNYGVRHFAPARRLVFSVASAVLVVVLGALAAGEAATGYGRIVAPKLFAAGDPTLDALEWSQLPRELEARQLLRPGTFVITTSWISAGKIAQALHDEVPVVVFGNNPRQFGFRYEPRDFLGRDALLIAPADSLSGVADGLRPYFASLSEVEPIALGRSGRREIELRLLLAHELRRPLPAPR